MRILLDWRRIVDFLVLAFTFYVVLRWASRARALRIALAIIALYSGVLFARQFDLIITAWILEGAALIAVGLLIVVFQPEVRRALMRLDRTLLAAPRTEPGSVDRILADCMFDLATTRTGALFALVRKDPVDELIQGGAVLGADVSGLLIQAIFEKASPLHDGAAIVEGGRILRAGAVLPLSQREDIPPEFGTRHRAAMGLAERADAIVIAVSEERGEVTVMRGRSFLRMDTPYELLRALDNPAARGPGQTLAARTRALILRNWRFKLAALGLASLVFSIAILDSSSTVRLVDVPIEFQNVPRGLDIVDQSVAALEVQLRGRRWIMDSNRISGLLARFDLRGAKDGTVHLHAVPGALNLPPGMTMMHVSPEVVSVRLVPHARPR